MRSLPSLLIVAALALAAVLAADAGAEPGGQPSPAVTVVGAGPRGAKPRLSKAIAVSKPHRKHRAHKKRGSKGTPAAAPTPPPVPAVPPGQLLFAANFDTSFRPWLDVQSLTTRATISTAHPFEGSGAGRFEVQPGDIEPQTGGQRSEVSGPEFSVGQDIFVRDEIRVPTGYSFKALGS